MVGFSGDPRSLRFFRGQVSNWLKEEKAYLVDGVVINGVSGAPAICLLGGQPTIIGVVAAYMPNRATGEVLPGLSVVRGVTHLHKVTANFRSFEAARSIETPPAAASAPAPAAPDDSPE